MTYCTSSTLESCAVRIKLLCVRLAKFVRWAFWPELIHTCMFILWCRNTSIWGWNNDISVHNFPSQFEMAVAIGLKLGLSRNGSPPGPRPSSWNPVFGFSGFGFFNKYNFTVIFWNIERAICNSQTQISIQSNTICFRNKKIYFQLTVDVFYRSRIEAAIKPSRYVVPIQCVQNRKSK